MLVLCVKELLNHGLGVGKKRVIHLMAQHGSKSSNNKNLETRGTWSIARLSHLI
jgi:hypothetical protein